jgi:hypothetical protein
VSFSTTTRPDIDDPAAIFSEGNTTRADTGVRRRCGVTGVVVRGLIVRGDVELAGCDNEP